MTPNKQTYQEATSKYDPVLGIECHVELNTNSKAFDNAPVQFGGQPNSAVTPTSAGLPGSLPTLNKRLVESGIRLGLALNCKIEQDSFFARKNYFYPDLPKAYQISQSNKPIAYDGYLDVELGDGEVFRVEIERAHLEEDAGKNTHVGGADGRIHGATYSLVDYNRSSVPLIEIVSKPLTGAGDRVAEVAAAYVQTLRDIAIALDISDARMERGNLRADVNVSLRPSPDAPFGTRTETKNVNSFRAIERAVEYEVARQADVLDSGELVFQETRHFHEEDGTTSSGRPKSDADDYRYFPDPDLPPVRPQIEWIEELRATLPEMPAAKRKRLRGEWKFTDLEMRDVVNAGALDLIDATVTAGATPAAARKWWMGELSRVANNEGVALAELAVTPLQVAELQGLIDSGALTDSLARQALDGVLAGEGDPAAVAESRGLVVVSDDGALTEVIQTVLAENPDVVEKIRGGKVQAVGALVGGVMKLTKGKADAARVRELIMEMLEQ